jgi:hypothetical protein
MCCCTSSNDRRIVRLADSRRSMQQQISARLLIAAPAGDDEDIFRRLQLQLHASSSAVNRISLSQLESCGVHSRGASVCSRQSGYRRCSTSISAARSAAFASDACAASRCAFSCATFARSCSTAAVTLRAWESSAAAGEADVAALERARLLFGAAVGGRLLVVFVLLLFAASTSALIRRESSIRLANASNDIAGADVVVATGKTTRMQPVDAAGGMQLRPNSVCVWCLCAVAPVSRARRQPGGLCAG